MSQLPTVIISTLLVLLLVAYVSFAYRYARYSPWNATWQGVTLEAQKATMAGVVAFFIADTIIGVEWPGRYSLLVILLTLLMVEAWATLGGLLHVQRAAGKVSHKKGAGYVEPEEIEPAQISATSTSEIRVVDLTQEEGNAND